MGQTEPVLSAVLRKGVPARGLESRAEDSVLERTLWGLAGHPACLFSGSSLGPILGSLGWLSGLFSGSSSLPGESLKAPGVGPVARG